MDRFSESCSADLCRASRQASRCYRDEDGCPDPEEYSREAEDAEYEPPFEPLCSVADRILYFNFRTVSEYLDALKRHKARCAFCRGEDPKKTVQIEHDIQQQAGKKVA